MDESKSYLSALQTEFKKAIDTELRVVLIMCGLYQVDDEFIHYLDSGIEIVIYTRLANVEPSEVLAKLYTNLVYQADFTTILYLLQRSVTPPFKIFFYLLHTGIEEVSGMGADPELVAEFNRMKDYLTESRYPPIAWTYRGNDVFSAFVDLAQSNPDVVATYVRRGDIDFRLIDDLDEALQTIILNTNREMDDMYADLFTALVEAKPDIINMRIYPHKRYPNPKTILQGIKEQKTRFGHRLYEIVVKHQRD